MKTRLAIVGAGDFGELLAHYAIHDNHYEVIGFYDDFAAPDSHILGLPVLGKLSDVEKAFENSVFDSLMIGIGYKHFAFRKEIFERFEKTIHMGSIIHSSAFVDNSSHIGAGSFILPGVVIDKHVTIGKNVLLNTAAVIAHDSSVGDHSFVAPRAAVAGKVVIQECCMIGINATIIDNVNICSYTVVGGGAVVTKNITKKGVYVGVPAGLMRAKP